MSLTIGSKQFQQSLSFLRTLSSLKDPTNTSAKLCFRCSTLEVCLESASSLTRTAFGLATRIIGSEWSRDLEELPRLTRTVTTILTGALIEQGNEGDLFHTITEIQSAIEGLKALNQNQYAGTRTTDKYLLVEEAAQNLDRTQKCLSERKESLNTIRAVAVEKTIEQKTAQMAQVAVAAYHQADQATQDAEELIAVLQARIAFLESHLSTEVEKNRGLEDRNEALEEVIEALTKENENLKNRNARLVQRIAQMEVGKVLEGHSQEALSPPESSESYTKSLRNPQE